ncbi:Kynurenine 3-monooxygenase [Nonlabens ulvanivorans]|uniref:Kynurenine 3-monooxygenase n=1 Tax=Nonlabens ulvanivorans TaxID=906888 RepID=A0A090QB20_NONUL|nr:NAD(P)/FAD-dependent oxidoreductase [Nonlabens ulvanivorans]GAL00285.1 Kynurenine 3-monooxygenase [Nonlabens ulvanivorans]
MKTTNKKTNILITGAGLCGSLLGLRLAQRGYHVDILEKRPDMRKAVVDGGRSINLALSDRGLAGLKLVGLEEKVRELCIPMHGRLIHDVDGNTFASNYSGREGEYINSISREELNKLLLDEADKYEDVQIDFDDAVTSVDLKNASVTYHDSETDTEKEWSADIVLGTDGAGSVVRKAMMKQRDFLFSHSMNWLPHGYKELNIPPTEDGKWRIDKNFLHIWPRGGFMLIALPNLDGSFTLTLFMQYDGDGPAFNKIKTDQEITDFFTTYFKDVMEHIPDLIEQYHTNPAPPLGTVRCSPWTAYGTSLIMGDAAHAIVPFYGQGMNASFEDVVVFDEMLDQHENWSDAFDAFSKTRKPDADAIADLALDNFVEMRDSVANPNFQLKRQIEMRLEAAFAKAEYQSKYSLVTFPDEGISYREAMLKGRAQDKAILWLLENEQIKVEDDINDLLKSIQQKTEEVLWLRG